jgi:hypothetical protein
MLPVQRDRNIIAHDIPSGAIIKINQEESQMLVEMYPELEEYLDDQGKNASKLYMA